MDVHEDIHCMFQYQLRDKNRPDTRTTNLVLQFLLVRNFDLSDSTVALAAACRFRCRWAFASVTELKVLSQIIKYGVVLFLAIVQA